MILWEGDREPLRASGRGGAVPSRSESPSGCSVDNRSRGKRVWTWEEAFSTKRRDCFPRYDSAFSSHKPVGQVRAGVGAWLSPVCPQCLCILCGVEGCGPSPLPVTPPVMSLSGQAQCSVPTPPSSLRLPIRGHTCGLSTGTDASLWSSGRPWQSGGLPVLGEGPRRANLPGPPCSVGAADNPACVSTISRRRTRGHGPSAARASLPPANQGQSVPAHIARRAHPARCN